MASALVIIDPRVDEFETLLSGLPEGTEVLVLNAEQDGAAQIVQYLAGRSHLDALHIISHGNPGTLFLGASALTEETLTTNAHTWGQIGQSLSDTADILLYGCNVAEGETGQQFIQALASYTGADVAASTDATGAAIFGGNWVLESTLGSIESEPVLSQEADYAGLLSIQPVTLNFAGSDVSIYGLGAADLFSWSPQLSLPEFIIPIGEVPGLGLTFSLNVLPMSLGLDVNAGISGGVFDLNYPISASVVLPNNVRPGDSFVIDTNMLALTNPSLVVDGPGLELSASAGFSGLGVNAHLQGALLGFDVGSDLDLLLGAAELELFNLNELPALEGKLPLFGNTVNLRYDIDLDSLDKNVTLAYTGTSLQQIDNVFATSSSPWFALDWDIDDSIPNPIAQGLDTEIDAAGFTFGYGAASFNLIAGFAPYLSATTNITGVEVTFTPTSGTPITGMLGDDFEFTIPDDYAVGSYGLTASYKLLGEIDFEFGWVGSLGIKAEFGSFSFDTPFAAGVDVTLLEYSGSLSLATGLSNQSVSLDAIPLLSQSYSVPVSAAIPTDVVVPQGPLAVTPTVTARVVGYTAQAYQGVLSYLVSESDNPDNTIVFRVERSGSTSAALDVNYAFAFGAGLDADDFVGDMPSGGVISFASGESFKDIEVHVQGDDLAEANEKLTLTIASTNAYVATPQTTLVIMSDDGLRIDANGFAQGTEGNDWIVGSAGNDEILAGPGNDTIEALGGNDYIEGGSGNDIVVGGRGSMNGGSGNDVIDIRSAQYIYAGSYAAHLVTVTSQVDAGDGNDQVFAGGELTGNAVVDGGSGFDQLTIDLSGTNNSSVYVRWDFDRNGSFDQDFALFESAVTSGEPIRAYTGYLNNNYITSWIDISNFEGIHYRGSPVGDVFFGNDDLKVLSARGGNGTDTLYADWSTATDDIVWNLTVDNDTTKTLANGLEVQSLERLLLRLGSGDDTLKAIGGNDVIYGGDGDDVIDAGSGSDEAYGGAGNDTLIGGPGTDTIHGGSGFDRFIDIAANLNADKLLDFSADDLIEVTGIRFSALRYNPSTGLLEFDTTGDGSYSTDLTLATGLISDAFRVQASDPTDAAYTRVWLAGDADGDGIFDDADNAIYVFNSDQRDTDGDGYGNIVDADLNQDLVVDFFDLSMLDGVFGSSDANADFNGDGSVDFFDLSILDGLFGQAPGPSYVDGAGSGSPAMMMAETLAAESAAAMVASLDANALAPEADMVL